MISLDGECLLSPVVKRRPSRLVGRNCLLSFRPLANVVYRVLGTRLVTGLTGLILFPKCGKVWVLSKASRGRLRCRRSRLVSSSNVLLGALSNALWITDGVLRSSGSFVVR